MIDPHDLPMLARFWTEGLGWKVLSQREREIVIGTDDTAPVVIYFMPVTDNRATGSHARTGPTCPWLRAADHLASAVGRLVASTYRLLKGPCGDHLWWPDDRAGRAGSS